MSDETIEPELEEDVELKEKLSEVEKEDKTTTEAKLGKEIKERLSKKRGKKAKEEEQPVAKRHQKMDALIKQFSEGNANILIGRGTDPVISKFVNFDRSPFSMAQLNALLSHDGKPDNGGAPHGRFIVLSGNESCGKTSLALDCIANRLRNHPDEYALILDAENSVDEKWYSHFGIDPEQVVVIAGTMPLEDMGTEGLRILKYAHENEIKISIVLVDSLGAMAPAIEMEGKKEGRTQLEVNLRNDHVATSARKINQMLRAWNPWIARTGAATFLIAHMMMDIGGYGGAVMKGGKGLKHFMHVNIELSKRKDPVFKKKIRCKDGVERDIDTGFFILATIKKTKISPFEGHQVALPFLIGVGFQTEMAIVNSAMAYGILEKAGAWIKYKGETIAQGQTKAIEWLSANPDKRIEIEQALSTAMFEEPKNEEAKEDEAEAKSD